MKEEWQDEIDSLYKTALELGHNPKEAQEFSLKRLQFLYFVDDEGDPSNYTEILKMYPVDDIKGYNDLPIEQQLKVLWYLGIDTNYPTWENVYIKTQGTKKTIRTYICGSERTDEEWVRRRINGKRIASEEAQVLAKRDLSLSRELNNMTNSNRFR